MKLGDERVHHYAHKINIACAATNPETAQHLNTKFHIYNELLKSKQLIITKPCYGRCGYKKKFI
jgi:competence CoiA-like predicted nuclease